MSIAHYCGLRRLPACRCYPGLANTYIIEILQFEHLFSYVHPGNEYFDFSLANIPDAHSLLEMPSVCSRSGSAFDASYCRLLGFT